MSSSMITGPGLDGASAIQAAGGAVQESRDLGQATPITYGQLLTIAAGGISGAGVSVSPRGSMKVATVMACARVVAWGLARMPLHVYRRTNYGRVRAWEHPTYKLLRMRPNPEMGAMSMRSALMLGALLWGNGYAEIVRNRRGEPVQIVPIESDRVCPRRLEETDELVYRVRTNRGERVLLKHEIIHVPGLSYDGITGLSVISHAREVLGASILADRMQGTLVKNNLRPSGVVIHPGKLGPQGTANLRESITRHNTGENVGVPLILEEGMTWIPGSMSLQDASWIETSRLRIEDICGLFGVPPHMIMHAIEGSVGDVEQRSLDFLGDTIEPWATLIEEELNWKLFEDEDGAIYCEHLRQALVKMNTKARGEHYAALHRLGAISSDEIREAENRNRLRDERGSTYWVDSNKMPLPTPAQADELLKGWASKRGPGQPEPKTDDKASGAD